MDPAHEDKKRAIVEELNIQRDQLSITHDALLQKLSVAYQFRQSIERNPVPWAIGSAVTAAIAAKALRRPRDSKGRIHRRTLSRTIIGVAFGLARPFVAKWAMDQARHRLTPHLLERIRKKP